MIQEILLEYLHGFRRGGIPQKGTKRIGHLKCANAEVGGAGGGATLPGEAGIPAEANPSASPVLLPRVAGEAFLTRWVREEEVT